MACSVLNFTFSLYLRGSDYLGIHFWCKDDIKMELTIQDVEVI